MTSRKLLISHLKEFDRLAHEPVARQLAWASQVRGPFMDAREPLLKAHYLLKVGSIRDTVGPMSQVTDELLLALRTFRANRLEREVVRCLARLSYWYNRRGLDMATILAGRMALASQDLPPAERVRLAGPVCLVLAVQLHLPAAWSLYHEVTAQARRRDRDPQSGVMVDQLLACLHFVEALRARRLPSLYCLDLEPGEADMAASDRHLAACEQHLHALREKGSQPRAAVEMQALACAVRGDVDGMLAVLGRPSASQPADSLGEATRLYNLGWSWRVLGRVDEARTALAQALQRLEAHSGSRNLLMVHHELSVCAAAAGAPGEAHAALGRYVFHRARLAALDLDAVQALVREAGPVPSGLLPLPGLLPQQADPRGADARLRASEPPCLLRAENLYLAQLPRRLPLTSLAEQAGVALRTLQAAARNFRQVTLTDMLRTRVMTEALTRVLHSDLPLKDIAEQLGYHEAATFSRDFKRVHGAAPSGYRSARPPAAGGS